MVAAVAAPDMLMQMFRRGQQAGKIDPGRHPLRMQQVNQILRGRIAGGARRKGAAAQSPSDVWMASTGQAAAR